MCGPRRPDKICPMRIALTVALAAPLLAQRPVPVDNEWARVVVAENKPGAHSRLHKHDVNRVMIHLSPGVMRLAFQDGPTNDIKFKAGDVRWDPKGGLHTSENVGGTTYQIVEVELKKPGDANHKFPELDPVKVAGNMYRTEFENEQVRVVRIKIPPGASIPKHTHGHRISVALTPVVIEFTNEDGSKAEVEFKAGEARFGTPATHSELSKRNEPSEIILIDLKGS